MLKVAIATDGPYGERAFENIKREFDTEFIELEPPASMFVDQIDIPVDALKKIKESDILITYTQHPDLTLDLVDMVNKNVEYIIVAAWSGEGFKSQLENYDNVTCPYIMCEMEENGNPVFDEFTNKIGKPQIHIQLEKGQIVNIDVIRSSPCGSTKFVVDHILDKYSKRSDLENLPLEAGLKLQHYPCRASKMRLFTDEECKKEMASGFHKDAFEDALKRK